MQQERPSLKPLIFTQRGINIALQEGYTPAELTEYIINDLESKAKRWDEDLERVKPRGVMGVLSSFRAILDGDYKDFCDYYRKNVQKERNKILLLQERGLEAYIGTLTPYWTTRRHEGGPSLIMPETLNFPTIKVIDVIMGKTSELAIPKYILHDNST